MIGQQDRTLKAVVSMFVGGLSALLGYILAPHSGSIANTYPSELYLPAFFMLVGAGLIVLGLKKLIN